MTLVAMDPVFYDVEASGLDGYPIEIGWAYYDRSTNSMISESHIIRPAVDWAIEERWDLSAEELHGISLEQVCSQGSSAIVIAKRMNLVLQNRALYSDSPFDANWLGQLFEASGLDPAFHVKVLSADQLLKNLAVEVGVSPDLFASIAEAKQRKTCHRAEADARALAVIWGRLLSGE